MSRNQCLLRYGRYPYDLYSRCSMWFPCIATQLPALRCTQVCTLSKIPGFTQISWQAFSVHCCNTSKSLIGTEYTKVIRYPHSQKSRGLKSGDYAGQFIGPYLLFTESLIQVLSVLRKWGGAPSCMNHMCCHWWRDTYSKSTGKSFTKKRWYSAPVSLLGKITGPKCWSQEPKALHGL
jgi:hypothetical protein